MGSLEHDDCRGECRRGSQQAENPRHAGSDVRYRPIQIHHGPLYQTEQVAAVFSTFLHVYIYLLLLAAIKNNLHVHAFVE